MKTQVAIIGSGPAGLLLSEILYLHGIENIVVEKKSRSYILSRIRAGVLEQGTIEILQAYGLGERIKQEGIKHHGFNIAWGDNHCLFIDLFKHANKTLTIYGQTQIQKDLFEAADKRNAPLFTEVDHVKLYNIDTHHPYVIFTDRGEEKRIDCDFIVGCDGYNGVSRKSIPDHVRIHEKIYPFGWLGILSPTPPLSNITYARHQRGFALSSARNPMLSRYYIQVPADTDIHEWSDDRFWCELKARYPRDIADAIVTGPAIEKSLALIRSSVVEQMRHGRLFLAGDAAHILPPTGAKGLNLAVSDVAYLSRAFIQFYQCGLTTLLDEYSRTAMHKVWHAMRMARYMTKLLHTFPNTSSLDSMTQEFELHHLKTSQHAQAALAEIYAGLSLSS